MNPAFRVTALILLSLAIALIFLGCAPEGKELAAQPQKKDKVFLAVDFQPNQLLRYRFLSHRDIKLQWESKNEKPGASSTQKSSERFQAVFAYRPVKLNPYGVSTIEAKCESVKAKRTGTGSGKKDAVTYLKGKSFTLKVDPRGRIVDYSDLSRLAYQIAEKAFRSGRAGKIKDPDMTADFLATQWFLWDAVSSIPNPAQGLSPGAQWKSELSVPLPMVKKAAREVTYQLSEITREDDDRIAKIQSTYVDADDGTKDWPLPYKGSFRVSGMFGFLGRYKLISLKGTGTRKFNIDKGRIESNRQQYRIQLEGAVPGGLLGVKPKISINQKIEMELLEN